MFLITVPIFGPIGSPDKIVKVLCDTKEENLKELENIANMSQASDEETFPQYVGTKFENLTKFMIKKGYEMVPRDIQCIKIELNVVTF